MPSEQQILIGISLGTLFTTISVLNQDGQVQTIADFDGERNIPTAVTFSTHDVLCGTQAKIQSLKNVKNTITQFRSLLGKRFEDPLVAEHISKLKLDIVPSKKFKSTPCYHVQVETEDGEGVEDQFYTPRQVMIIFLKSIKSIAEAFLGTNVSGCVLSQPTLSSEEEIEALKQCATETGFEHVYLVKEPVAALLAYKMLTSMGENEKVDKKIAVIDFGGHQFNVTIMQESNSVFSIRSSVDDGHLGGIDLDRLLFDHMAIEFQKKYRMDVKENRKAVAKLLRACESTKKMLSQRDVAPCVVESLIDGLDLNFNMNRGRFDILLEPMLKKCQHHVLSALEKAQYSLQEIDQVFLIGGCSRVPKFADAMAALFHDESVKRIVTLSVEPDEIISKGCCFHVKTILEYGLSKYQQLLDHPESNFTGMPATGHSIHLGAHNVDHSETACLLIPDRTLLPLTRKFVLSLANVKELVLFEAQSEKKMHKFDLACIKDRSSQISFSLTIDAALNVNLTAEMPNDVNVAVKLM